MAGKLQGSETARIWTKPRRALTPATSKGFAAIEFAEAILELSLLPWQKWLLIHALELNPDGSYRFRTVVLLVARQNGKSTIMLVLALWRMYADGAPLVIGTAQNLDIAEEMWTAAVEIAESIPELADLIEHVDKTNGKKALRLETGERYKVAAASRRGGRGLSGDLVLLDELREHQTWDAWGAVTKTTMARLRAQVWAASNAGDKRSIVLAHLRLIAHLALGDPDGIAGDAGRDPQLVDDSVGIFEWSAAPKRDIWDRDGWAEANPSLGHTIDERAIAAAASTDPEAVFRTEVLCQWVDHMEEGAFPPGVFAENVVALAEKLTNPTVALEVKLGVHQAVSIGVVGDSSEGTVMAIGKYESGFGQKWAADEIVQWVCDALDERGIDDIVVDTYGENGPLIPLLENPELGMNVHKLNTADMRNACMGLHRAVLNGEVKHLGEEPLAVAVAGARRRKSGEGWIWSRETSVTDIGPLMACAAAWWMHSSAPVEDDYDVMSSIG